MAVAGGAAGLTVAQVMGANGCIVCDCGHTKFTVLMRLMPNGNNHIVAVECEACEHQMVVPFTSSARA